MKRRGFTLIELLVVIAIIAILASILFPVFARARENARRSACQSNMKQIGLGFLQYAQDFDEKIPYGFNGSLGVIQWVPPLMPYVKSEQVFVCPSDATKPSGTEKPLSYAANGAAVINPNDTNKITTYGSLAAFTATARTVMAMEVRGSTINYTDTTQDQFKASVCTGDTRQCLGMYGNGDSTRFAATGPIDSASPKGGQAAAGQMWSPEFARHFEGANYLCADGHVKWFKPVSVSGGQSGRNNENPDASIAPQRSANGEEQAEGAGYSGTGAHAVTFSVK